MTTPLGVEFRPLTVPASVDADDAADFIAMTHARNAIYAEISGNHDEAMTPAELLPHYAPDPDELRFVWAIVVDGRIIGRVGVDIPLEEGSKAAYWLVELLNEFAGRGIGSAGYELVERTAREHGRTVLQSWAEHPDTPGPRLTPPTGFGTIPDDRAARFYRRHGYTLEQVERRSTLDLAATADRVDELLADAETQSSGYRVAQWLAPTPPEYAEAYAWAKSRMSTDVPAAGLEFDEERWDADRLARHEQRLLDGGHATLVTVALDGGDAAVAFNELQIGADRTKATHQQDTLVLKEHRGHRLGQLVKCAGLRRWRELVPESPHVVTYNAEENRPMLDINERLGFLPEAYSAGWKKVLDA